jgi:hypothetical protein
MPDKRLSLLIESQTRGAREVDKVAQSLNRVVEIAERSNKKFREAGATSEKTTRQFSQFGSQVRSSITSPLSSASGALDSFLGRFGKVGGIVAGAVAGFGALGTVAFRLQGQMGALSDEMLDMSARTGLTVNQVDKFRAMSQLTAISLESMSTAGQRVAQAVSGIGEEGKRGRRALELLGVSIIDATGAQRELGDVFEDTLRALSRIDSAAVRLAIANEALGESGKQLAPLINNYARLERDVGELGFGQRGQLIQQIDGTREAMARLNLQLEQAKWLFATIAAPVLEGLTLGLGGLAFPAGGGGRGGGRIPWPGAGPQDDYRLGQFYNLGGPPPPRVTVGGRVLQAGNVREVTSEELAAQRRRQQLIREAHAINRIGELSPYRQVRDYRVERIAFMRQLSERPLDPFAVGIAPSLPTRGAEMDPERGAKIIESLTQRRVNLLRQAVGYEEQMARLIAGPGGEVEAINTAARLRIDAAQTEFQITQDRAHLELETQSILRQRELEPSGRTGLSAFFRAQGLGVVRQIVGNLAEETYRPGMFTLPGQGTPEKPTFLGRLLSGTPFGMDPLRGAMSENTLATIENTMAIRGATIGGGGGVGGRAVASSVAGTVAQLPALFRGGGGSQGGVMLDPNLIGVTVPTRSRGGRVAGAIGRGATTALHAYGIYQGIREGGTQGTVEAAGSGAMLVGSYLPPPAGPIVQGVGLAAKFLAPFLGPNTEDRASEIDLRIENAIISVEGPTEFRFAGGDRTFDYDATGQLRTYRMTDEEVAEATIRVIHSGHRLREELREAVVN